MNFARLGTATSSLPPNGYFRPQLAFGNQHGGSLEYNNHSSDAGPQSTDQVEEGFEFDQNSFLSFRDFDQVNEGRGTSVDQQRYGRLNPTFELSPAAPVFEARTYNSEPNAFLGHSANMGSANNNPNSGLLSPGLAKVQPQQQLPKPNQAVGNSFPSPGPSLSSSVIDRDDHMQMANFVLEAKHGDERAAIAYLRGVLTVLVNGNDESVNQSDWDGAVRGGPPYLNPEDQEAAQAQLLLNQHNSALLQAQKLGVPPRPTPIAPITLIGDEIDQRMSTLVIAIPGKAHIVGHLIGKGGAEVGRIERDMSVTIKIESASKSNVQLIERSVCIIGTVAATTFAQQFVSHKVHEKLLSEGVQAEVLKMIVPNDIVRHLIGKSGSNINRLQNESGARIQVEPESTMNPGSSGRIIVLQGAERCRTFAQYLILRQVAEDRNLHPEWSGKVPANNGSTSPNSPGLSPQPVPNHAKSNGTSANQATVGAALGMTNQQALKTSIAQLAPNSSKHGLMNSLPPSHSMRDEHTLSINVPDQVIPYLIGRNGAAVAEVQNQSGAKIHIAKGNGKNTDIRRINISGNQLAVEIAQQMIQQKLQMYRGPNGSIATSAQE